MPTVLSDYLEIRSKPVWTSLSTTDRARRRLCATNTVSRPSNNAKIVVSAGHPEHCRSPSPLADILSTLFVVSSVRLLRPSDHQQSYRWMKSQEVKGEDGRSIMTLYLHPTNSQKCPRCWLFTRKATDATCARCTDVLGHA